MADELLTFVVVACATVMLTEGRRSTIRYSTRRFVVGISGGALAVCLTTLARSSGRAAVAAAMTESVYIVSDGIDCSVDRKRSDAADLTVYPYGCCPDKAPSGFVPRGPVVVRGGEGF